MSLADLSYIRESDGLDNGLPSPIGDLPKLLLEFLQRKLFEKKF